MRTESLRGISDIAADEWDLLAGENDPFIEHGFLSALERSGCVGPAAGWLPRHVTARDERGQLVGATPLYLKDHSFGEYIFDWAWAEASEEAGIAYYPKLVAAVPFTPVTGQRLLGWSLHPDVGPTLIDGVLEVAHQAGARSAHWLFVTPEEVDLLTDCDRSLMPRMTHQYHWHNRSYRDFDAYLRQFRAPDRKKVRRERRKAHSHGLRLSVARGADLEKADWRVLYELYLHTGARKWGQPYLNAAFFDLARAKLAHRVIATLARDDAGRIVAAAMSFQKGAHLYGRYWGSRRRYDALHFELCYYMPIELCIAEGWTRFEAGAQGEHKIKRGLLPQPTFSAHWVEHPAVAEAVERFVTVERQVLSRQLPALASHGPFRRPGPR